MLMSFVCFVMSFFIFAANVSKELLRMRLRVNTVSSTVVVKNVVGVIQGGAESGMKHFHMRCVRVYDQV